MRIIFTTLLFVTSCASTNSKLDSGALDSGAWWLQDTEPETEPDGSDEEWEEGDFEPGTNYYGAIDADTWSDGIFAHEYFSEDGGGCIIEGELINVTVPGNCSDCVIDVTVTVSGLQIVDDLGACDDGDTVMADFEGLELAYGQGAEFVGEEGGMEFYELFENQAGDWVRIDNGVSVVGEERESGENIWGFFVFSE